MRNEDRRRTVRQVAGVAGAAALVLSGMVLPAAGASAVERAGASWGSASADGAVAPRVNYVGGGLWEYGVSGGRVWSKYQHPSRVHKATACSAQACAYSGWKSPNYLAVATRAKSAHGNTAFWEVG